MTHAMLALLSGFVIGSNVWVLGCSVNGSG